MILPHAVRRGPGSPRGHLRFAEAGLSIGGGRIVLQRENIPSALPNIRSIESAGGCGKATILHHNQRRGRGRSTGAGIPANAVRGDGEVPSMGTVGRYRTKVL
jgi:hypothetical protein